ncbi:gamma carbonic anhydrase family protein [Corallincola holothuriorum]|uniref:Gamma carbonic anhydrase family protein n=1 Tax=Corallincola holothuriorum TaxID=2282215 RepID=A0A368N719_9GAMM|nr:gamma carbonic anhydrase family protein [Corallincola holothuriorum]RCU45371.1 gamma carbonic anhydrase family protein [Corallincola holothuriorum]
MLRPYKEELPHLSATAYVDEHAVVIGAVSLAKDVSVWPMVVIRGDVNRIEIGARSNIQDGSIVHVTRVSSENPQGYPTLIGEDVTIGHQVMLHGCVIGDRVLVGMSAVVMDNVTVEDDVIIAAGSVVPPNKTLTSGYLYKGNPAKQARPLSEAELSFLKRSANNYVVLKDEYIEMVRQEAT